MAGNARPLRRVLDVLEVAKGSGELRSGEYVAFCPAHDDRNTPNLHVSEAGEAGGVLLHCFAGCAQDEVLAALEERGVSRRDLFPRDGSGGGGESIPSRKRATLQPHPEKSGANEEKRLHEAAQPSATPAQPCTLETYAEARRLPVRFLRELGLSTVSYMGVKAVRMPYLTGDGQEDAVRLRLALEKAEGATTAFGGARDPSPLPTAYGVSKPPESLATSSSSKARATVTPSGTTA